MRIGVFGGTFDPVHVAHLIMAEQCREQGRLDRVLFVPAARPPHKQQPLTKYDQRVEMLALAISGNPAFGIDELEKDRPGPSYTADTLQLLKERESGAELALIIGSDSVRDLPLWYQPGRILELAELLVVERPNSPIMAADELRAALKLPATFTPRIQVAEVPLLTIASRDIRRRLREGRSVRYLIPRSVEAYIADKALYRD